MKTKKGRLLDRGGAKLGQPILYYNTAVKDDDRMDGLDGATYPPVGLALPGPNGFDQLCSSNEDELVQRKYFTSKFVLGLAHIHVSRDARAKFIEVISMAKY